MTDPRDATIARLTQLLMIAPDPSGARRYFLEMEAARAELVTLKARVEAAKAILHAPKGSSTIDYELGKIARALRALTGEGDDA